MLKRLLSLAPVPVPASTPRSAVTVRETGQRLSPISTRKDWTTMVCFSCGRSGHRVSRYPQLNKTFPYLLPGWSVERGDGQYMAVSPGQSRNVSSRETTTDRGWGGGGGQPPGSVIHVDSQTLVVVHCPPSAARGRRHGPCPQKAPNTARGLIVFPFYRVLSMISFVTYFRFLNNNWELIPNSRT